MKIDGKMIIEKICERLLEENTVCSDSEIVRKLRELTWREIAQLTYLGDVCFWHRDRENNPIEKP